MSIAILGGGAFGTALAIALVRGGKDAVLWARDPAAVAVMRERRTVPKLPGAHVPHALAITGDLAEACEAPTVLLAVPMQQLAGLLSALTVREGAHLVACCKGIDLERGHGPTALISERFPQAVAAILTGPSFAADIAIGLPTALTLACRDAAAGVTLQSQLSTASLRIYQSDDPIGAELGGALKNVIAIACGVCIGAGLGDSARAALMTRGFAEMQRFAQDYGAKPDTLMGLSGLGDLSLTCNSELSRNFRYGAALGRGEAFDSSVTVEGAATARIVAKLSLARCIDMPISTQVAHLVTGQHSVAQALDALLSRPLTKETRCSSP